ncbi:recombinase family protein [Mycobacterium vicinigordonae]|uniref:recombinase family protein n=1 Tax=Mycobacterium vicinigordonae TaxID=1719132 RepID=UPI001FE90CCF|nr:recombinase family protein [Mycobacterium vicinigordonae]
MCKQNGRFVNTFAAAGRVIAYVRVSTDEQAASGAGLEAQRAAIEAEAARRGWTIVGWHADTGISGSKRVEQRPVCPQRSRPLRMAKPRCSWSPRQTALLAGCVRCSM